MATANYNSMMVQIQATRPPARASETGDLKPLLKYIEDIVIHAANRIPGITAVTQAQPGALDDKALQNGVIDKLKLLANPIHKFSCEISCKCSGNSDAHATTTALVDTLSSYSWDAKVLIPLAAFAGYYVEFSLVVQLYPTNPLAKAVALLKKLPDMESADRLKRKFEAVTNLIKAMLDLTESVVKFQELSSRHVTPKEMATWLPKLTALASAVYLIIRSIVTCAPQIMTVTGVEHDGAMELIVSLVQEISEADSRLQGQLGPFYKLIEKKKLDEAYRELIDLIEKPKPGVDITRILKALIYAEDHQTDQLPLFDGSTKTPVNFDKLTSKYVLLLVSDLEPSQQELLILKQMYKEANRQLYEVVWFPVVDGSAQWNDNQKKKFEKVKTEVPWHSVSRPYLLQPAVLKYIKDVWHYNKKPLVVVLDQSGIVVNSNAIPMIYIWRNSGFPFSHEKELSLLEKVTRTFDLLPEPLIPKWIEEKKYICFYGGTDMKWIQEFAPKAIDVAKEAGIKLEMLYLGKSNARETVNKMNIYIVNEKLGHTLSIENLKAYWVRLESMWRSKIQHGKSVEDDTTMEEITTLLSFDGTDKAWAVICQGSDKMAKAKGDTFLDCLNQYHHWKAAAKESNFIDALNHYLERLRRQTGHHCNRLIFAGNTGSIPDGKVICVDCKRPMEKLVMYRCCQD